MKPLEQSYYVAVYPSGRIVEKHLTRKEAAQYCSVFNRTLPSTIAWANFHPEFDTSPGANPNTPPPPPSTN